MLAAVFAAAFAAAPPAGGAPPAAPEPMAAPPQATREAPQSIWKPLGGGEFEHLQSGLRCPAASGDFQRDAVTAFDGWGLDVACGYKARDATITFYLTRGGAMAEAYDHAKAAIGESLGARGAQLVADGLVSAAGLEWRRARYTLPGGGRSDLWLADAGGWQLKFRMTYLETAAPAVDAQFQALTGVVRASAIARLSLCAKSQAPARPGKPSKAKAGGPDSLATLLAGSVAMAAADDKKGEAGPPQPIAYCFEEGVADKGRGFMLWRGVTPDGADANSDRLTVMTLGPPPALEVSLDETGNIIAGELTGKTPERWMATTRTGNRTTIYGYFDKRPSTKTMTPLMQRVLDGKAQPLGGYDADGKTVTINVPTK